MVEMSDPDKTRDLPPPPKLTIERTKWFTLSPFGRYWLCYSVGKGEDRYFISKGSRRVIESFPMTDQGWAEAWGKYAELEPAGSQGYIEELDQRERTQRETRLCIGWKAVYTGGLPEYSQPLRGGLFLSNTAIGLGESGPEKAVVPLTDVASIEIADGTVAKSKVAATLAFGVLGATGSRGTKTELSVVVHLKTGSSAYFLLPDSPEGRLAVRAKIGPLLHAAGIPFTDGAPAPAGQIPDIADQLRKLATLRDEGVLSPDEFDKAKARFLA